MVRQGSRQRHYEQEPLLDSVVTSQSDSNGSSRITSPIGPEHNPLTSRSPTPNGASAASSRRIDLRLRFAAAVFSFAVLGLFVSTTGVIIPRLESYYHLSDLHVSVVFLVPLLGYVWAAQLNSRIHRKLGQRGIAVIGPLCHVVSAAVAALHPPFPVYILSVALNVFGSGLLDGSWCAWAGAMENASTMQGFLHGGFSIGAAAGPALAGAMFDYGGARWFEWYYVLLAASVLEMLSLFLTFRAEDAERYREDGLKDTLAPETTTSTKAVYSHKVTWICAAYCLAYVGTEYSISGWIVVFMTRVRHASPYLASVSSSGFWIAQAAGRLTLGALTDRIGVRTANAVYLAFSIAFGVLFAVIDAPVVSMLMIMLQGYSLGPAFPSCIVMVTGLLPRDLHVAAVSFVASVGQVGGALLPFGLGAAAEGLGIQVFQAVILGQLTLTLLIWLLFPRLRSASIQVENEHED
ncbi:hypothetical protein DL767_009078 [Monosporascus sp. MG133]|nr:hypothetical protein DL767_009078 [Monosporascus sp. MG133]